jgi:hypothetical protein
MGSDICFGHAMNLSGTKKKSSQKKAALWLLFGCFS